MKKLFTFFLASCVYLVAFSQNILIADNNAGAPSGTHVFSGLQDAIDAATDGDVIHVIPSPNNYGSVTISASQAGISLYGIGFNPDKDGPAKSTVTTINLQANNVKVSGIAVTDQINFGTSSNSVTNVAIENCDIYRISSSSTASFTGSNFLIRNCYISRTGTNGYDGIFLSSRISNCVITNCIIGGNTSSSYSNGSIEAYNGCVIKNNVFFGNGEANKNAFDILENCTVSNNIFFGREPRWRDVATNMSNCVFNNNVSAGAANNTLPPSVSNGNSGNNNFVTLTDSTLIFDNPDIVIGDIWDYNWEPILQTGSILENAGTDGTHVGPTGSTIPWDPTGVPLPLIQSVISPEVIKQGDNMDVTIKARGN